MQGQPPTCHADLDPHPQLQPAAWSLLALLLTAGSHGLLAGLNASNNLVNSAAIACTAAATWTGRVQGLGFDMHVLHCCHWVWPGFKQLINTCWVVGQ